VESEPGKGSTFWFTLRLHKESADKVERIQPALGGFKGARILVVIEENQVTRENLENQLNAWGVVLHTAVTSGQTLDLLRAAAAKGAPFHLAIIDKQLKGDDGVDLARRIKQDPEIADVRLVMLSSVANLEQTGQWMKAGIEAYLTKPVRQSELYSCLAHALKGATEPPPSEEISNLLAASEIHFQGHILVAEDNPVNQELALQMLQDMGCRVHIAANGEEAVDALTQNILDQWQDPYDLVLMDCQMPKMDGFEATVRIRQWAQGNASGDRRIPIIALTANAMEGDREKCLAAGMDDYLSKPFSRKQLSQVLERWLPLMGDPRRCSNAVLDRIDDTKGINKLSHQTVYRISAQASTELDRTALDSIRALQQEGQPDILAKIIRLYLTNSAKLMQHIEEAVSKGDAVQLRDAAHGLKSSSANVGASKMTGLCKDLEGMGRDVHLRNARSTLDVLEFEYQAVCSALEAELSQHAA